MIIFLVGFMGSGKSTIGKKLASRLSFDFSDLDEVIEKKEQKKIMQFFSEEGEESFRRLEQQYLHQLVRNQEDIVVATGGGTPCFYNNMDFMNMHGITIYLQMDYKSLFHRLKASKNRPLLTESTNNTEYIKQLLEKREAYYSQSKLIVSGLSLKIEELLEMIKKTTQENNLS